MKTRERSWVKKRRQALIDAVESDAGNYVKNNNVGIMVWSVSRMSSQVRIKRKQGKKKASDRHDLTGRPLDKKDADACKKKKARAKE